ncbi:MAG: AraC family transcriptional regulator [Tissierellia bacterium]|nr:AraC family transcriptional regulator [Tissierellia bacterium]
MSYTNISQSLRPETYKFCQQDLKKLMESIGTADELRRTLIELNTFLYANYLLRYQKDFEDTFKDVGNRIQSTKNYNSLLKEGHIMLQKYLACFVDELENNDDKIIRKALSYINNHYYERVTLKTLSEILFISENYLCRLFREKTGYRFCEYVNLLRVERAKALIKEGNKTLDYISYLCGFSSQSHFSVTFKKYVNMPPGKYKSMIEQQRIDSL